MGSQNISNFQYAALFTALAATSGAVTGANISGMLYSTAEANEPIKIYDSYFPSHEAKLDCIQMLSGRQVLNQLESNAPQIVVQIDKDIFNDCTHDRLEDDRQEHHAAQREEKSEAHTRALISGVFAGITGLGMIGCGALAVANLSAGLRRKNSAADTPSTTPSP